jgi:acetolactate synthase-1/2/3 large subunit
MKPRTQPTPFPKKIRTILPRHEQGGGFMAARLFARHRPVGVCMATSGPGATNLVTAIADAYMDSIPLVSVTGQVPSGQHRQGRFPGDRLLRHDAAGGEAQLPRDGRHDIPRIVKEAFYIANSGRPGPVVIDIPKDMQQAKPADLPRARFRNCAATSPKRRPTTWR